MHAKMCVCVQPMIVTLYTIATKLAGILNQCFDWKPDKMNPESCFSALLNCSSFIPFYRISLFYSVCVCVWFFLVVLLWLWYLLDICCCCGCFILLAMNGFKLQVSLSIDFYLVNVLWELYLYLAFNVCDCV